MTKHYRDQAGAYIGGFGNGATPPDGAIECPLPPSADAVWNGTGWDAAPAPVPGAVSSFQVKEALRDAGLYDQADTAANAAGGRTLRAWQSAQEFPRDSATIAFLATGLGLSEAQVDDLFKAAAQIAA